MAEQVINLFVLYKIIRELSTPFKETKAFELGLIDEKGKLLKRPKTKKEKQAYSYFYRFIYRFIFNLKRLLAKVGLESRIATFAAALFLLKEEEDKEYSDKELLDVIFENIEYLKQNPNLMEEIAVAAPTNATPQVPGAGSDVAHWKPIKDRKKRKEILRRALSGK
jgi:DNA primase large subunit